VSVGDRIIYKYNELSKDYMKTGIIVERYGDEYNLCKVLFDDGTSHYHLIKYLSRFE